MREFTTTKKAHDGSLERLEFAIDTVVYAARRPKDWHLLELSVVNAADASESDKAAALRTFVATVFEEPGATRLLRRLRDPADDLDVADVGPVIEWLIGEWSGRPIGSASA